MIKGKYSSFEDISHQLKARGFEYRKWKTLENHHSLTNNDILEHYKDEIDEKMKRYSFKKIDIVSMTPSNPNKEAFRKKLLDEHITLFEMVCSSFFHVYLSKIH